MLQIYSTCVSNIVCIMLFNQPETLLVCTRKCMLKMLKGHEIWIFNFITHPSMEAKLCIQKISDVVIPLKIIWLDIQQWGKSKQFTVAHSVKIILLHAKGSKFVGRRNRTHGGKNYQYRDEKYYRNGKTVLKHFK